MIEWSENIEEFLPEELIKIKFGVIGENDREIDIEGADEL